MTYIQRFYTLVFVCLLVAADAFATQWMLQGRQFNVDTLYYHQLRQGITEGGLKLSGPAGIRLFYVTVDLQTPGLSIVPFKGCDADAGLEPISQTMNRLGGFVCGVNADFFSWKTHQPLGAMVIDGNLLCTEAENDYSYIAIDSKNNLLLTEGSRSHAYVINGKDSISVSAVNRPLEDTKGLILYTSKHKLTADEAKCPQLILQPAGNGKLSLNQNVKCLVKGYKAQGNDVIADGSLVLLASDNEASLLEKISRQKNLTLKIEMTFADAPKGTLNQLVAGKPMLLRDGKVLMTNNVLDHLPALHPRTAVGTSADKRYLTFLVVDGHSKISAGMTSYELADALREMGCSTGMNLDGGGSSELYIMGRGAANCTSDGYERTVTNGVGVRLTSSY